MQKLKEGGEKLMEELRKEIRKLKEELNFYKARLGGLETDVLEIQRLIEEAESGLEKLKSA